LIFVGEVMRGDLILPIPSGFSIRSSMVPLPGRLDGDLQLPMFDGDVVHLFDRDRQDYAIHTYRDGKWTPTPPVIAIGESFWIGRTTAGNWVQSGLLDAAENRTD
jgi:hypothetical protein